MFKSYSIGFLIDLLQINLLQFFFYVSLLLHQSIDTSDYLFKFLLHFLICYPTHYPSIEGLVILFDCNQCLFEGLNGINIFNWGIVKLHVSSSVFICFFVAVVNFIVV